MMLPQTAPNYTPTMRSFKSYTLKMYFKHENFF